MTKRLLAVVTAGLLQCFPIYLPAQSKGPGDRQITDPAALVSKVDPAAHPVPIDDLFYTKNGSGASWSPDGKEIAITIDISGRQNLWKVAASGGWPVQLVQSDERQQNPTWSPDGKWIVYQQDAGGSELWDVFAVPSDGGAVVNLTNTPEVREQQPRWSPDGRSIALDVKGKEARSYDIAIMDFASRRMRPLTNEKSLDYGWTSVAWSADGKTLYADRYQTGSIDADVYSIDVQTGTSTNLTMHQGKVVNLASSLSPDGKTILLTSNEKGGFMNVALLDLATKHKKWVTDTQWESNSGDYSPAGKSFTYTLNADGLVDTYLVDAATLHAKKIGVDSGVNGFPAYPSSFSPSGDRLMFLHESSVQPSDLWIYDTASAASKRLTRNAIASLSSAPMPASQVVHYKSFDGKMISALLWLPLNLQRDASNPGLVLPHGGPTSQSQDFWSPRIAALVSRGYVCIAPNVRGSTGYGMEFQQGNLKDLGGADLQDEVYAAKFLQATGYVSARKIGITGGSYGGFMSLMAIGRTPEVWAASVELYGIINWMTMLQSSDPVLQQYEKSLLGDPVADKGVYDAASPITYIHQVKAPLLVLQGDNDPRVPKEEATQVVDLLKKDGKIVEVHYYPDEGHGFEKRENQIDAVRRTIAWFDKYLKGQP